VNHAFFGANEILARLNSHSERGAQRQQSGKSARVLPDFVDCCQHIVDIALFANEHILLEEKRGRAQLVILGKVIFSPIFVQAFL
jgi:hypothetical protein